MIFYIIISVFINTITFCAECCTQYYVFINTQNHIYCNVLEELPINTIEVGPCFTLSKMYKNLRTERNSAHYALDHLVLENQENRSDKFFFEKFGENNWALPNSIKIDKAKLITILRRLEKITDTKDKDISTIISLSNPTLSLCVKKSKSW